VVSNLGDCFWDTFFMVQKIDFQYYCSLACYIDCNDCNSTSNTIKSTISVIEAIAKPIIV
jgi:hypothetical protein